MGKRSKLYTEREGEKEKYGHNISVQEEDRDREWPLPLPLSLSLSLSLSLFHSFSLPLSLSAYTCTTNNPPLILHIHPPDGFFESLRTELAHNHSGASVSVCVLGNIDTLNARANTGSDVDHLTRYPAAGAAE